MPTVSGAVTTPAGQPCPGVYVYAASQADPRRRVAAHTDSAGRWALELPAGTWTVREVGHRAHDVEVGDVPVRLNAPTAESAMAATVNVLESTELQTETRERDGRPAPTGGRDGADPTSARRSRLRLGDTTPVDTEAAAASGQRPHRTPRDGGRRRKDT